MKATVYNTEGKEVEQLELPEVVFGVAGNPDLLHQAVQYYLNNQRQVLAHTKDRSEVSGGGKKPWRQKGTGRARHGSIRSPIWVGGGVSFGPTKDRVFSQKMNTKMRRKALFVALSEKLRSGQLILVDSLPAADTKTKALSAVLEKLPVKGEKALLVLANMDRALINAAGNLSYVKTAQARELNALEVLRFRFVVMTREAVQVILDTFNETKHAAVSAEGK